MIYIKISSGRNKRFTKTTITKENMQDDNKTITAKDWILKLANGINPLNGSVLPDDDIVNNVHISRCLFYVAELIGNIESTEQKKSQKLKRYDKEFNISAEDLAKVALCEKISISNFAKEINKFTPQVMKPLSYKKIREWLVNNGYLETVEIENFGTKNRPTSKGAAIGISSEIKEGNSGKYWVVEYNSNAQRFILNNIYAIIGA